jgi:hypothetical protein
MGLFQLGTRYEPLPGDTFLGAATPAKNASVEALMAKATKAKTAAPTKDAVDEALARSAKKAAPAPSAVKPTTTSFSSIERDKVTKTFTALKGRRPVSREDVIASRKIAERVGAKALVAEFDKAIKEGHAVPEIPAAVSKPVVRPQVAKASTPAPKTLASKTPAPKVPAPKTAKVSNTSATEVKFVKSIVVGLKKGIHVRISDIEKAKAIALKDGNSPRMVAFLDESLVSEQMYASLKSGGLKVQKTVAVAAKAEPAKPAASKPVPVKVATRPPVVIPAGVTAAEWTAYKQTISAVERNQKVSPLAIEKAQKIALDTGHTESADILKMALEKASPGRSRLNRPKNLTDNEWALYAPVLLALSTGAAIPASRLVVARRIALKSGHSETASSIEERMPKRAPVLATAPTLKAPMPKASAPKAPVTVARRASTISPKAPATTAAPAKPSDVTVSDWQTYVAVKRNIRREMIVARSTGKKEFSSKIPTKSLETAMNVGVRMKDQALVATLTDQFRIKRELLAKAKIEARKPSIVATEKPTSPVASGVPTALAASAASAAPAAPYGIRPIDWKRYLGLKEVLAKGKDLDVVSNDDYEFAYNLSTRVNDTQTRALTESQFGRTHKASLGNYMAMKRTIVAISQKKPVPSQDIIQATSTAKALGLTKTQASLAAYTKAREPRYEVKVGPATIEPSAPLIAKAPMQKATKGGLSDEALSPTTFALTAATAVTAATVATAATMASRSKPAVSKKEMSFVAAIVVALDKGQSVRTKDLLKAQEIAQRAGAAEHAQKLALAIGQKRSKDAEIAQKVPPPGVPAAPSMVASVPIEPSKGEIVEAASAVGVPPALVNAELQKAQAGDPVAKANVQAAAETLDRAAADDPAAKAKIDEIQAGVKTGNPEYKIAAAGLGAAAAAAGAIEIAQKKTAETAKEEVIAVKELEKKAEEVAKAEAAKAEMAPEEASSEEALKAQIAPGGVSKTSIGLALAGVGVVGLGIVALASKGKTSRSKSFRTSTSTALTVRRPRR